MFGSERMKRHSSGSSLSNSSSSSSTRSSSDSWNRRRIFKLKKKLKHYRAQCTCRSQKVEERKRHKSRQTDSRKRCRHGVKRGHWCEKIARNSSEESSDDQQKESSTKKGSQDQKLKQCDMSYSLAPCNSSRCCCGSGHTNSRSHTINKSCPNALLKRQEGEDLSRIYYKKRRKKHNFACRTCHTDRWHHDDDHCRRCCGSDFESISNKEQNSSILFHQNFKDCQSHDVQSSHNLNKASEFEANSTFKRHDLVHDKERAWSAPEPNFKYATVGGNESDWLMLSLERAKAASLSVKDCELNDFKLCLPGYSQSGKSMVMEEIDLNVAIDEGGCVMRTPTPLQLPPPPDFSLEVPHVFHPPGSPPGKLQHREGHGAQGEIILLESTDEEHTHAEDKNRGEVVKCLQAPKLELNCDEYTSSNADRGVAKSLEDSVPWGYYQSKKLTAERSPELLQRAEGEVVDTDGAVHDREIASINSCMQDYVNRMQIKDEERDTVENGSAHSVVLADDGLTEKTSQDLSVFCDPNGFKARKKRIVQRPSLFLQEPVQLHEKVVSETAIDDSLIVQKAFLNKMIMAKSQMWDADILCDLCHKGPSLFLGEWYSWCCGVFLSNCRCPPELQMKLKSVMRNKKGNKAKKNEELPWSGKVHKMCALWSSEVFEEDEGDRLQRVFDAVRRGKSLTCAGCKDSGATLGCRVKSCHRSYHYPCADRLASKLQCRMWDGVHFPVACHGHRHVEQSCQNAKEKVPDLKNWRKRGFIQRQKCILSFEKLFDTEQGILARMRLFKNGQEEAHVDLLGPQSKFSQKALVDGEDKIVGSRSRNLVIDLSSDSENTTKETVPSDSNVKGFGKGNSVEAVSNLKHVCDQGREVSRYEDTTSTLYYMGINLLNSDISGGHEELMIPCTNDVDADPAPDIVYITQNRYLENTRKILDTLLMDGKNLARSCEGCDNFDIDDPHEEVSMHVSLKNGQRESDTRMDWQGQPMLGRLPYDRYGRLQLGSYTNDVIECNSRCPCGPNCLSKDLQKGLKIPLEVFKTKDRGWGVRTMKQIPRGKFAVECVGELLTYDEAKERGIKYDMLNLSCLFSMDHPELSVDNRLVVDWFNMSNVARFINHSCGGNLRVYRVYTEISDLRFYRIGMYAARDIEIGEELSYDYKYFNQWDTDKIVFSKNQMAIKCCCGSKTCRQWL